MYYTVTFSCWVNEDEPLMRGIKPGNRNFLVEANNKEEAIAYAKRFESLETHSYEGLNKVISVELATEQDKSHMSPLSIYENYLKLIQRLP